jgi:crotonobetainyl-CoA:carnitine CoA-transferase CaiB-like acyl-CoA transferase
MGHLMSRFGVFETTHTVAAATAYLLYRKVGRKSALLVLAFYWFAVRAVKKKLKTGGLIRKIPKGPYAGIVVLDLSMVLAGPLAAQMFSELGAYVINIESVAQPDAGRLFGRGPSRGLSGMYSSSGRGKQSIVLDFKTNDGLQAFYDLVNKADVVIQNFRPGAVERMKVGFEDCKRINPDIIYCSSSGFGRNGPYKDFRVYDPIIQTIAGAACAQNSNTPQLLGQAFCDKMTAMTSAQAIGAALVVRANGGGAQHIETNMLKVALQALWPEVYQSHTFLGKQNMLSATPANYQMLYSPNHDTPVKFNSVRTAMNDSRYVYEEVSHLLFGKCRQGTFPISFSETPVSKRECAVLVGEHTRKVLTNLGYSSIKINSMLKSKAATSTQTLIQNMAAAAPSKAKAEINKKAMVFGLLETVQEMSSFPSAPAIAKECGPKAHGQGGKNTNCGALSGVKVVEFSTGIAGPTCGQTLSNQEANIIKVEFHDIEDPTRSLGTNGDSDYSAMFASLNRQKLSIQIRSNEEEQVIDRLLKWADVVLIDDTIEIQKSITYTRAKLLSPNVVYCVIEGFDVFDELHLQALTGASDCQPEVYSPDSYMTTHGRRSSGIGIHINIRRKGSAPYYAERMYGTEAGPSIQPSFACISVFAKAIGAHAASGITAALYVKATQGCGQKVVVNALTAGCHYAMPDIQWNGVWPNGIFLSDFPELVECYTLATTKDGVNIFTISVSDKEWADARTGYLDDAVRENKEYWDFINNKDQCGTPFGRIRNVGKLYEIMRYAVSKCTYQQLVDADGVLVGPVNEVKDVFDDPQIKSGKYFTEVNHPSMGRQRQPTVAVNFSSTPSSIRRPASLLDEDRERILNML